MGRDIFPALSQLKSSSRSGAKWFEVRVRPKKVGRLHKLSQLCLAFSLCASSFRHYRCDLAVRSGCSFRSASGKAKANNTP